VSESQKPLMCWRSSSWHAPQPVSSAGLCGVSGAPAARAAGGDLRSDAEDTCGHCPHVARAQYLLAAGLAMDPRLLALLSGIPQTVTIALAIVALRGSGRAPAVARPGRWPALTLTAPGWARVLSCYLSALLP